MNTCNIITGLSPPVKYFTDRYKAVLLLWIFYVFFCLVFVICLRAHRFMGNVRLHGLGSRLWCITVSFVTFPLVSIDQVWYLVVSIPDLAPLLTLTI